MAKRSTVNPGRTGFPVRRPIELPPVYGDHVDLEAIECLAVDLSKFSGWEACDMVELAVWGGRLLCAGGKWVDAVMPLVTSMECRMRGQDPEVSPSLRESAALASLLRKNIRDELMLEHDTPFRDIDLVELCRNEL